MTIEYKSCTDKNKNELCMTIVKSCVGGGGGDIQTMYKKAFEQFSRDMYIYFMNFMFDYEIEFTEVEENNEILKLYI